MSEVGSVVSAVEVSCSAEEAEWEADSRRQSRRVEGKVEEQGELGLGLERQRPQLL